MHITEIAADLVAEQQALDSVVAPLSAEQWRLDTPSPRWTVAHQVGHLAYFDHAAATAITDPDRFVVLRAELLTMMGEGEEAVDEASTTPAPTSLLN
mgnify:CR=1 FL=1